LKIFERKTTAVTQKEHVSSSNGWSVGENEARLARARQAFDQGLREASEKGERAARRMIVPVLWGGALIGGALLAMAMLRLARRQAPGGLALLRVYVQPPEKPARSLLSASSLLPALGGALARMAVQHFLRPDSEPLPLHAASAVPQAPLTNGAPGQPHTGNDRDRS